MLNRLKEIEKLSVMKLNDLNQLIKKYEDEIKQEIKSIEMVLKNSNVIANINESYTISLYIKEKIGIYIAPAYSKKFNSYTCQKENKIFIWYQVRDSIHNYYNLLNAKIKPNCIKTFGDIGVNQAEVIKEYKNGNFDYKKHNIYLIV